MRVSASSAPSGSSKANTRGWLASARARDMRCFCPPDSTPGQSCPRPARPTCASTSAAWRSRSRRSCACVRPTATLRCDALPRQQTRLLEHQPRVPPAVWPSRCCRCPAVSSPAISRNKVVLPQPLRPTMATNCARLRSRDRCRAARMRAERLRHACAGRRRHRRNWYAAVDRRCGREPSCSWVRPLRKQGSRRARCAPATAPRCRRACPAPRRAGWRTPRHRPA